MGDVIELDVHFNLDKDDESVKRIVQVIRPSWDWDNVKVEVLAEGLVNFKWKCSLKENKEDILLIRTFDPEKTYMDHDNEVKIVSVLNQHNICMPIYCIFTNGYVYQYEEGNTLKPQELIDRNIYKKIIEKLHQLHAIDVNTFGVTLCEISPFYTTGMSSLFGSDAKRNLDTDEYYIANFPPRMTLIKEATESLKVYNQLKEEFPLVFVHGDPHTLNTIYNPQIDRISLIDWEVSGSGFELQDIATNWSTDIDFAVEDARIDIIGDALFKRKWLHCYLETHPQYQNQHVTDTLVDKWLAGVHKQTYIRSLIMVMFAVCQVGCNPSEYDFWRLAKSEFRMMRRCKAQFSDIPVSGCQPWTESEMKSLDV